MIAAVVGSVSGQARPSAASHRARTAASAGGRGRGEQVRATKLAWRAAGSAEEAARSVSTKDAVGIPGAGGGRGGGGAGADASADARFLAGGSGGGGRGGVGAAAAREASASGAGSRCGNAPGGRRPVGSALPPPATASAARRREIAASALESWNFSGILRE